MGIDRDGQENVSGAILSFPFLANILRKQPTDLYFEAL